MSGYPKHYDCGHYGKEPTVYPPWPALCPRCKLDAEREFDSQLWANVRTLGMLVFMLLVLVMTCAGPR